MLDISMQKTIDALFASVDAPGSPGCALGVMKDGQLIYKKGYGLANLEHQLPITPKTTFYIASMAKQFTGFAIALLADQGKLDLDADIRTFLSYAPDFGQPITPKHLLYHTSGLRSDIFLLMLAGWRIEDVITQQDVIGLFKRQRELDFAPGEEFSYCGMGYILLAEIVAAVSGQSFPDFCREHIFHPLGMTSTHFEPDPLAIIPGRANAYLKVGEGEYKNAVLTISLLGGTGVYTTIEDLALWDENFYTCQVGNRSVIEWMQTPGKLNSGEALSYAFGLIVGKHRGRLEYAHGGDSSGIHCTMMRIPDEHLSVAILGNFSALRPSAIASSIVDLLLEADDDGEAPSAASPCTIEAVRLTPQQLESRAGRFFNSETATFVDVFLRDKVLLIYGYELSATSEDEFFFTQHPEATAVYHNDAQGSLALTLDIGHGPNTYQQIHPVEMKTDELAAFVGTYYSLELDVTWHTCIQEDRLIIQRRRHGASVLCPVCQDVFSDPWVGDILHGNNDHVISFDRSRGRVSGLRVTAAGGRGRNLRFERMA